MVDQSYPQDSCGDGGVLLLQKAQCWHGMGCVVDGDQDRRQGECQSSLGKGKERISATGSYPLFLLVSFSLLSQLCSAIGQKKPIDYQKAYGKVRELISLLLSGSLIAPPILSCSIWDKVWVLKMSTCKFANCQLSIKVHYTSQEN